MAGKKGKYETKIKISGELDRSFSGAINQADRELQRLYNSSKKRAGFLSGVDSLGRVSDATFRMIAGSAKTAAAGMMGIGVASTAVGASFEKQMSSVRAISGATAEEMKRLNELAKEAGRTTQFSATEAGQGLEYMAMAGWNVNQMAAGLPAVLNLAAASGEDLGMVSDIVTDSLTAFGLAAEDAAMFSDVLAEASNASNTDVARMGETFQYVAPVAGALKYSIQDIAIATGLMANAGIKGEKAGTSLRAMMTNLAKPTKQTQGYMDALSISLTDSNGQMKPFRTQLVEMRAAFADLTEAQKAEYAAGIAGKEGMSGMLAMINASESDFQKLAAAIDNSAGAAEEMAKVRIDNLSGDLTLLQSAAESAGIELYGVFSPELRKLTQESAGAMSGLAEDINENLPSMRRNIKLFGEDVREGVQPLLNFGEWCVGHPGVVQGTLMGISGALLTFKAAQGIKAGISMLGSLSGMIGAWPVAAAGLAVGGIVGITTAIKANNRKLKKEDMARRFGDISLSLEELDETARKIVMKGQLGDVTESLESMKKVKGLADEFEDASVQLDRLNWKIGMNFGLDAEDQQTYEAAVKAMAEKSADIIQQSQYTAQLSVQALFGTDSDIGSELIEEFNGMYSSIYGEVESLGKQLGEAYSTALEDGVIDIDESKTIQELQKKLADITQQVSQAQFDAKLERISAQTSGKDLDVETFKNLAVEIDETLAERQAGLNQSAEALYASLELEKQRKEITPGEYETRKNQVGTQLNQQTMMASLDGLSWAAQSIEDAYSDVLGEAAPEIWENFNQAMTDSFSTASMGNLLVALDPNIVKRSLGLDQIDQAARDGIEDLWSVTQPMYEQLQGEVIRARQAGEEIPKAVMEGLNQAEMIGMIAGDTNAIWSMMGQAIGEDPEFKALIQEAQASGAEIPEEIAAYIESNTSQAKDAVDTLWQTTKAELDRKFGLMTVNGTVQLNLQPGTAAQAPRKTIGKTPAHYASGGLISSPTLSWFAEESPEMAIPLDGSKRSMDLWEETGRLLGAYEENNYSKTYDAMVQRTASAPGSVSGQGAAPLYQPVMNFYGNTSKEDVEEANEAGFERFREWYERFMYEQARVAF